MTITLGQGAYSAGWCETNKTRMENKECGHWIGISLKKPDCLFPQYYSIFSLILLIQVDTHIHKESKTICGTLGFVMLIIIDHLEPQYLLMFLLHITT